VHVSWAVQCLDEGVRLPELGHHIQGGAPVLLDSEEPTVDHGSMEIGLFDARMSVAKIAKILEKESAMLSAGYTMIAMSDRLVSKVSRSDDGVDSSMVRTAQSLGGNSTGAGETKQPASIRLKSTRLRRRQRERGLLRFH